MSEPTIRLQGVHKSVHEGSTRRVILAGLDFELQAGACAAILGRSGSGKSTLLNVTAGLDVCDRGLVSLCGQELGGLDEAQRARLRQRHVGFVFQSFHLLPQLTAFENVLLPLELQGQPRARSRDRVEGLLRRVGLGDRGQAFPAVLSGGEQQRLAVARALACEPAVVLADEPTGNLDDEAAAVVLDLLQELVRQQGSSLVLVTHSLQAAKGCDRTLRLEHGALAALEPMPAAADAARRGL